MKRTLTFFCDPGHSWLKVGFDDIHRLNLGDDISRYSYMRGEYVYLEEDCDAPRFIRAANNAGWNITLKNKHTNRNSRVRSYDPYYPQV